MFPPLITVGNTFPLVITVGNRFPIVITVENTFPLLIRVGNTFALVITVGNGFPLVITVVNMFPLLTNSGKNNGSSFFQRKSGTYEMSSMGHRKFLYYVQINFPFIFTILISQYFFSFFMKSSFLKISVCLQFIKYGLVFMLQVTTGNKFGKGVLYADL